MLFIVGWITWIAYEPVHLAGVAMDTRPRSLSLSLSHAHTSEALKSGDVSFLEISSEILFCWGAASSCSCEAAKLSNTQRLCWPRPLANLSCRQHRVLADLNQSVKVSAPSSFSPHLFLLRGFFFTLSPPPCFSHLTPCLSFLLKSWGFFRWFFSQVCFAVLTYVRWKKKQTFHHFNSVQSSAKATQRQQSESDAWSRCVFLLSTPIVKGSFPWARNQHPFRGLQHVNMTLSGVGKTLNGTWDNTFRTPVKIDMSYGAWLG